MSGLISVVYAQHKLDDQTLDSIDELLAAMSAPLQRTRKGRTWNCRINDRLIHVRIEETVQVLWDCEDELLELGLLPDDVPFRIVLSAACHSAEDCQLIALMASQVSQIINGIVVAPRL